MRASGPRYCPSIEDKVVRFADKTSHQIFIEPEEVDQPRGLSQRISTSLPFDVQWQLVRSDAGFENARITPPGYTIEYDFSTRATSGIARDAVHRRPVFRQPDQRHHRLSRGAAQGLLAGMNAALQVQGETAGRRVDEAYLGVLVDDLITRGTQEPYRMFTSRAEYRLMLRRDNADLRLTETGRTLGLVGDTQWSFSSASVRRSRLSSNACAIPGYVRQTWPSTGPRTDRRCAAP